MTMDTVAEASTLELAKLAIDPVMSLLGIARVVSVDDEHVISDDEHGFDADLTIAQIQSGAIRVEQLVQEATLQRLFTNADGEAMDDDEAIDVLRGELDSEAQSILVQFVALASDSVGDGDGTLGEADVADVNSRVALAELFGGYHYSEMTLAEWTASGASLVGDGVATLVFFDRNFELESRPEDAGDRLVSDLLERPGSDHIRCCLLTHSTTSEKEEHQLEEQISSTYGVSDGALVVLSKTRLSGDPSRFAARLLSVLFKQHLSTIRLLLTDAIAAGHKAADEMLSELTAFQLLAMFAAALKEGVHEPDHMLRPMLAASRRAMTEAVRPTRSTSDTLAPIHDALGETAHPVGLRRDDIADLQQIEMFDSQAFVARTVQPIAPGDIFQVVRTEEVLEGKKPRSRNHLILLAQPCDLMVRRDGERGHESTHLVLARVDKTFDEKQRNRPENVYLPTFLDGKPRLVRLGETVDVPSLALDLCVYDADGYSRLRVTDLCRPETPWSWTQRHAVISGRVRVIVDAAREAHLGQLRPESARLVTAGLTGSIAPGSGMPNHHVTARISVREKLLVFGLRRVGRLNDDTTRALLVQATHHHGRPAMDAGLVLDPASIEPRR